VGSFELRTDRLILRDWRETDQAPFAKMNADPTVMEFFPSIWKRAESDKIVDLFQRELTQ
jgi:RimJ/RimL family protein N-acetyltransferase